MARRPLRPVRSSPFFDWLRAQTHRTDVVGTFAKHAKADRVLNKLAPRDLHEFLARYEGLDVHRDACKKAHKEFRKLHPRVPKPKPPLPDEGAA